MSYSSSIGLPGKRPEMRTDNATLEASNAAAILAEGVTNIMPQTLVARPFSPTLHDITVQIGLPAARPNLHAERFAQLLNEEAKRNG